MKIHNNYPLKNLNAFKLDVNAKLYAEPTSSEQLITLLGYPKVSRKNIHIIGLGTNTLFVKDFDGLMIRPNIKGIKIVKKIEEKIYIKAAAGENWDELVQYAVNNNWSGIENLSLIPGTVGAAPVQNIAAYGQSLEDVFVSLEAINLKTAKLKTFNKKQCKFGYRNSIFKEKLRSKYVITSVTLKLSKKHLVDTSYHSRYDSIKVELEKIAQKPYKVSDVRKAVINIRKRKFPNPDKHGTAGSFFLNPIISIKKLKSIQLKYPDIQYYPVNKLTYPKPDDPGFDHAKHVKIAAGWLLEELGWKGKRIGNVGTSPNQSLVIISRKGAKSNDIIGLSEKMNESFYNNFGIKLDREVNIV